LGERWNGGGEVEDKELSKVECYINCSMFDLLKYLPMIVVCTYPLEYDAMKGNGTFLRKK
jgi:hypothetical protein